MSSRKPRKRFESELDYTKDGEENSKILLREKYELLKWTDTIEIKSPNLFVPAQIANYIGALPFCKVAVSPRADRVAVMNHNRILNVYTIDGETTLQDCSVQVLEDDFAEYCLLHFSASGSLILSTRSSAQVDVFDHTGAYCYDIPLAEANHGVDLMYAVSAMSTVENSLASSDDKFMDILYVLQYNGTFSVFKIGRLSRYYKMWSVSLDIGLAGSFSILPEYNLLLVASHFRIGGEVKPPGGLCSFRLIASFPHVEPIRVASESGGWLSRLPFSSARYAFLSSISVSSKERGNRRLSAVATNGDFFLFDVPSTNLALHIEHISGPRPVETRFVDDDELAILFENGDLVRSSISSLRESIHSINSCDSFTARTTLCVPAPRELFVLSGDVGSTALHEVANQRTSLACRLWIYTLWSSFKQLVGMAVGDAASPLQMATHSETLSFSLWHTPTRTLQQLFERTLDQGNYSRAKELAASYQTIDSDIILKREWRDVCHAGTVTATQVDEILKEIGDEDWIAEECATSDAPSRDVQLALVALGASLTSISDASRIRILHNGRLLSVCEDVSLYIDLRDRSCLDAAFEFAMRGDFVSLERLISQNLASLSPYTLDILSRAPSSILPSRYEHFIVINNGEHAIIDKSDNEYVRELERMASLSDGNKELVDSMNTSSQSIRFSVQEFVAWLRERAVQIDEECGLAEHAMDLMNIGIQRGYKELENDAVAWKFYASYVQMCSLINETYSRFVNASVAELLVHIGKLTESELVRSAESICSLVEWRLSSPEGATSSTSSAEDVSTDDVATRLRDVLSPLLIAATTTTTRVLQEFRRIRPESVDRDLIIECLCNLSLTGIDLLTAIRPFSVCPEMTSAVRSLADRNVRPTFGRLWESTKDAGLARGILVQVASSGQAESIAEWETLSDDVTQLAESLYSKLLSREAVLELLAGELLSNEQCCRDLSMLRSMLTLDRKGPRQADGIRLGWERSAQILLAKSNDAMQDAIEKDDPLLARSRFFAEVAKEIAPKPAAEQLKLLDVVDLVHDLGLNMMPVTIKFADPNKLLLDTVQSGDNYKQGKKCARLAVLLGVSTPVASALSLCALEALERRDEKYLDKYINDVMAKARDIPVVHRLCMQIMESEYVPEVMDDIYACALLNCAESELMVTMERIESHRLDRRIAISSGVDIGRTDEMTLDPQYTNIEHWVEPVPISDSVRFELKNLHCDFCKPTEVATLLSHYSSSAALSVAMTSPDSDENVAGAWTDNDLLIRYEKALRFLRPRINSSAVVELIPPQTLIQMAFANDKTVTAIDRIGSYGVDRTRFIEDPSYRTETIVGLAMSEDEAQFADAVSLAEEFRIDDWPVHMASLENALTTCTISETKQILKTRGHLAKLRTRIDEFHAALRTTVFPLLDSNERFIAYLSLFADGQPEKTASPTLKKLLDKKKDLNGRRLFSDADYLAGVIVSMPDKYILALAESFRLFPVASDACESASRALLNGSDLRPPANLTVLYQLLGRDIAATMELVASKPLADEIPYLEMCSLVLEATPDSSDELKTAVRDRLSLLTSAHEFSSSPEPSFENTLISRRRH